MADNVPEFVSEAALLLEGLQIMGDPIDLLTDAADASVVALIEDVLLTEENSPLGVGKQSASFVAHTPPPVNVLLSVAVPLTIVFS